KWMKRAEGYMRRKVKELNLLEFQVGTSNV
nr:hypothetical protein [Tanacetum cinerariifolium]